MEAEIGTTRMRFSNVLREGHRIAGKLTYPSSCRRCDDSFHCRPSFISDSWHPSEVIRMS